MHLTIVDHELREGLDRLKLGDKLQSPCACETLVARALVCIVNDFQFVSEVLCKNLLFAETCLDFWCRRSQVVTFQLGHY